MNPQKRSRRCFRTQFGELCSLSEVSFETKYSKPKMKQAQKYTKDTPKTQKKKDTPKTHQKETHTTKYKNKQTKNKQPHQAHVKTRDCSLSLKTRPIGFLFAFSGRARSPQTEHFWAENHQKTLQKKRFPYLGFSTKKPRNIKKITTATKGLG